MTTETNDTILERQIINQIEGRTDYVVEFTDTHPEQISVTQQDGRAWIKIPFVNDRPISPELARHLENISVDERAFNTDPLTIKSGMGYDDFMRFLGIPTSQPA